MLINIPTYELLKKLHFQGKVLKVNHYDLGDGIVHKVDDTRKIIFMILEGDIFAFGDIADPEKAVHELRECAVFVVEPEVSEEED